MKLSFVFEEDEELLVSSQGGIPKPLARVVLTVTRTDGSRETVLTREFNDEFGIREESISFNTSEDEISSKVILTSC